MLKKDILIFGSKTWYSFVLVRTGLQHQPAPPLLAPVLPATTISELKSSWPEFSRSVQELKEWLNLLDDLLSTRVSVCDVREVEQALTHQKVSFVLFFQT